MTAFNTDALVNEDTRELTADEITALRGGTKGKCEYYLIRLQTVYIDN